MLRKRLQIANTAGESRREEVCDKHGERQADEGGTKHPPAHRCYGSVQFLEWNRKPENEVGVTAIWKSQRHIAKIPIECGAMPYGDTDLPGIGLTNFRPARVILHRFRTTLRISEYDAFRIHKRESRLRARRSFLGPVPHLRG